MIKFVATSIFSMLAVVAFTQDPVLFNDDEGKFGFKDAAGNVLVTPKYDNAYEFSEGLASVCIGGEEDEDLGDWIGGKRGFIDSKGEVVIAIQYEYAESFSEGLSACCLNKKWGFIDKTGKVIIPFKFDTANSFEEGRAYVRTGNTYFHVDKLGNEVK